MGFDEGQSEYRDNSSPKTSSWNISTEIDQFLVEVFEMDNAIKDITAALNRENMKTVQIQYRLEAMKGMYTMEWVQV